MTRTHRLLLVHKTADARAFAGAECDAIVVWDAGDDDLPAQMRSASSFPAPEDAGRNSDEEAGRLVTHLTASGWWTLEGVNVARLLRDILVREISQHIRTIRRVEVILGELEPDEVRCPLPLRASYYQADGMIHESARLVAGRRGIAFRSPGGPLRRARAAWADMKWRFGRGVTARSLVGQAMQGDPPSITADPSRSVCVGPCWAAELPTHRPVSDALRERGWTLVPFDIPFYYTRREWRDDTMPEGVHRLGSWGGEQARLTAERASRTLLARLARGRPPAGVFDCRGVDLLGSMYLRRRLTRLLTAEARLGIAMYESARAMLEALRPAVLLTVKAEGPEARALMVAAHDLGVPTAYMPHGVHSDDARWDDIAADLVLADGEAYAESVRRRSRGLVPVRLIGTPKLDASLAEFRTGDRASAQADYGLPPRRLWIGVATTNRPGEDLANIREAAAFAADEGDAGVFVKAHPRFAQPDLLRSLAEAAGPAGVVTAEGAAMGAAWCCDVVITGVSTAAIETLAAGRPVIFVGDLADEVHGYVKAGAAVHVANSAGVRDALTRVLGSDDLRASLAEKGRAFAARKLGPLDGRATERAVEEIGALVSEARR